MSWILILPDIRLFSLPIANNFSTKIEISLQFLSILFLLTYAHLPYGLWLVKAYCRVAAYFAGFFVGYRTGYIPTTGTSACTVDERFQMLLKKTSSCKKTKNSFKKLTARPGEKDLHGIGT